jgi:hypothetical protein
MREIRQSGSEGGGGDSPYPCRSLGLGVKEGPTEVLEPPSRPLLHTQTP